jgi:4-carboxymuconolactone decarboxylase
MESERFARGLSKIKEIDPKDGEEVVRKVGSISPDMAQLLLEYPFGDIYSRPGLDLKSREIAIIGALCALGYALPQLKFHISAGMHAGLTRDEIVEIIIQMTVYAGFPAALNALYAAQEVFEERGVQG